jgi:hypothetical protein
MKLPTKAYLESNLLYRTYVVVRNNNACEVPVKTHPAGTSHLDCTIQIRHDLVPDTTCGTVA